MRAGISFRATIAVTWACLSIVVLFGCSRKPKPGEWTGGYSRHEHTRNMQVRYACKTWHEKQDTVSYAVFYQTGSAEFGFSGRSFDFVLGESDKQLHLPYVQGRQYWIKPNGEYEIIEKPWSIEELRTVSQLSGELPGIRFDTPNALREYIAKSLPRQRRTEDTNSVPGESRARSDE